MNDDSVDLTGEGHAYAFEKDRGHQVMPAETEKALSRSEGTTSN